MACCGTRRAQLQAIAGRETVRESATASASAARPRMAGTTVLLRYLRGDGLSLRGPRTGTVYHVSGASPDLAVHPDDAAALLRTGVFAQAEG
jgi:hypothetical protein